MKATNKGTCQCCGAIQKLPNGKLSKHGYKVDWGMFSGTCQGSGELPFEQSKDLIESFIILSKKQIGEFRTQIRETVDSVDPKSVWFHKYIPNYGYVWEKRELLFDAVRSDTYTSWKWETLPDDKKDPNRGKMSLGNGEILIENAVKFENTKYIKTLYKKLNGICSYKIWQESRIDNWKEKPLKPLT